MPTATLAIRLTQWQGLVFVSASLVVFVEPAAAASGVPEVIAFLNGVRIPRIFNIRTLVIKFLSAVCAVASGLPVGPEGWLFLLSRAHLCQVR